MFNVSRQQKVPEIEQKKYILDLNAYIEKKNPMTLLKAFNLIKDKTDLNLVFCGGYKEDSIWNKMQEYMQANQISSRIKLLFRVKDEERNWLLANAALFVTPSLFEGFGRTPVEAAICKIPVISTKETSLFEATQGLCNYVENATDEKELGKPVGSDAENEKITYAALVGIEKAKSDVKKLTNAAVNQLDIFENSDFLKALALSLVNRKK